MEKDVDLACGRGRMEVYEGNVGDEELHGRVHEVVGEERIDGEICRFSLWKRKDGSV